MAKTANIILVPLNYDKKANRRDTMMCETTVSNACPGSISQLSLGIVRLALSMPRNCNLPVVVMIVFRVTLFALSKVVIFFLVTPPVVW